MYKETDQVYKIELRAANNYLFLAARDAFDCNTKELQILTKNSRGIRKKK